MLPPALRRASGRDFQKLRRRGADTMQRNACASAAGAALQRGYALLRCFAAFRYFSAAVISPPLYAELFQLLDLLLCAQRQRRQMRRARYCAASGSQDMHYGSAMRQARRAARFAAAFSCRLIVAVFRLMSHLHYRRSLQDLCAPRFTPPPLRRRRHVLRARRLCVVSAPPPLATLRTVSLQDFPFHDVFPRFSYFPRFQLLSSLSQFSAAEGFQLLLYFYSFDILRFIFEKLEFERSFRLSSVEGFTSASIFSSLSLFLSSSIDYEMPSSLHYVLSSIFFPRYASAPASALFLLQRFHSSLLCIV